MDYTSNCCTIYPQAMSNKVNCYQNLKMCPCPFFLGSCSNSKILARKKLTIPTWFEWVVGPLRLLLYGKGAVGYCLTHDHLLFVEVRTSLHSLLILLGGFLRIYVVHVGQHDEKMDFLHRWVVAADWSAPSLVGAQKNEKAVRQKPRAFHQNHMWLEVHCP